MSFLKSSIGRKIIMALTGLALVGFVFVHMLGNLQIFIGQKTFNDYAELLQSLGGLLWVARGSMIVFIVAHIAAALSLSKQNLEARPKAYRVQETREASVPSKYMLHTGILLIGFIILHLLHFTLGALQPEYYHLLDPQGRHDVYSMVIYGFQTVPYSIVYIVAMIFLGVHLAHAISSMFQTVGIHGPKITPCLEKLAKGISTFIVIGYIAIPVSVLSGVISLPVGG
jgi:succinate dehydrogenase / fumarate reductase cytochrome b subunit